jgi:hypothetical protein
MPADEIEPELRQLRFGQLPPMKMRWRVSMSSLIVAADRLRALPETRIRSLFVQLSRAGWRTSEPYDLSEEAPTLLDRAIEVHRTEHDYSIDELSELTDVWPEEFTQKFLPGEGSLRLRVLS